MTTPKAVSHTTFFLIEDPQRGDGDQPRWWTGERLQFVPDANAAARFTSRKRAESAMSRLGLSHLVVTDHVWVDGPTALRASPSEDLEPPGEDREGEAMIGEATKR